MFAVVRDQHIRRHFQTGFTITLYGIFSGMRKGKSVKIYKLQSFNHIFLIYKLLLVNTVSRDANVKKGLVLPWVSRSINLKKAGGSGWVNGNASTIPR